MGNGEGQGFALMEENDREQRRDHHVPCSAENRKKLLEVLVDLCMLSQK